MTLALLVTLATTAVLPTITIQKSADGYVVTTDTFDARQQDEVESEVASRAATICEGKEIRWGQFGSVATLGKYPAIEPAPVSGYSRQFSCVEPDSRVYEPAPAEWQPTASDEQDVLHSFDRYYSAKDAGQFKSAFEMFQPGILGDVVSWADQMAATNKKLGAGKRRVTGVTWYVNPAGAPHPGVYAAIDFSGEFPKAYVYCGYVVLFRRAAGSYEMTREEQNMFTEGDGGAEPGRIAEMRASMCRG